MKLKIHHSLALLAFFIAYGCSFIAPHANQTINLNKTWDFTETNNPHQLPTSYTSKIKVPSLIDQAFPKIEPLNYKKDTNRYFWYRTNVEINNSNFDVILLEIKKAKYSAQIYVNGEKAYLHEPAFISGTYNIKPFVHKGNKTNEIVIRLGTKENFPETLICGDDFEKKTYFPGIYDDVNIHLKKAPYIENVQIAPNLESKSITAAVEIIHAKPNQYINLEYKVLESVSKKEIKKGSININTETLSKTNHTFKIPLENYQLWSPENPFLYELILSTSTDIKTTKFGMRSFSIDPLTKKCLLNGKPYYLRGTNVALYRFFEDSLRAELPWNEIWVRELFSKFKSMNWNSLRFHVGPAPDFWYDLADEMGILIQDEYAIWYGKGGFKANRTKVTTQQLIKDYTCWMRERWNHPSIVIWDAQNETVADITGKALEAVRHIDLSKRPWDNGYSAPTNSNDIIEAHPYLFHDFHFEDSKAPAEGILKHMLAKPRLTYNDPNEQDPDPDGKYYDNAVILNEYGWLWVNRDGSPTTLSDNVYKNIFPEYNTPEQRIELYSKLIAILTEYWRAHQKTSGIQHFAGLTYSRPTTPRGQTCDAFKDVVNLEFHDAFVKYVKPAFSPLALMIDTWEKSYQPDEAIEVPVYVINDLDEAWLGQVSLGVYKNDKLIDAVSKKIQASEYNVNVENFTIKLPKDKGLYQLKATINYNDQKVTSYRDLNIR